MSLSNKNLCLSLIKSDSEDQIIKILKDNNYWSNENWVPYGQNDVENSTGTFGNQQKSADLALVEKVVNSIDATLMNHCYKNDIDPKSNQAPKNMKQAIAKFFNIYKGEYTEISQAKRKEIAENSVHLIASGSKKNPCISIYDKGEGQTPKSLPGTILSLHRKNKSSIPFVQGKYNMGGAGAISFCGKQNFQLVLSKKDPELKENKHVPGLTGDETFHQWGFTIVRKRVDEKGYDNFEYLKPAEKILSFDEDNLSILPGDRSPDRTVNPYKKTISHGTYIKLYEYKLGSFKTSITSKLLFRLELLLPSMGIPVLLSETRDYKGSDSVVATAVGMSTRLETNIERDMEKGYPKSSSLNIGKEKIILTKYAFKEGRGNRYTTESGKTGLLFIVNGQTHYIQDKRFYAKHGLDYIKNSLITVIDCSDAPFLEKRIFMSSRDRLREDVEEREQLFDLIGKDLKEDKDLKKIAQLRRLNLVQKKIDESLQAKESISQIINSDETLLNLVEGLNHINLFSTDILSSIDEDYEGNRFASKWHLLKKSSLKKPKQWPINVIPRIQYKTDVENNYFGRLDEPGDFKLYYRLNSNEAFKLVDSGWHINLRNSVATLNLDQIPLDANFDSTIEFKSELIDKNKLKPFVDIFFMKIDKIKLKRKKNTDINEKERKEDKGDGKKKQKNKASKSIPNFIQVYKDEWHKHSMNDEDALIIIRNPEDHKIFDYYVNMDNKYYKNQKGVHIVRGVLRESIDKAFVDTIGIIGMLIINKFKESEDKPDVSEFVREVSRYIAPGIIPLIVNQDLNG
jgi:hypothetical protein